MLARRLGIPISLAVIHAAVSRRVGLAVQLLNMPMHIVSVLSGQAARAFEAAAAAGKWTDLAAGAGAGGRGGSSQTGLDGSQMQARVAGSGAGTAAAAGFGQGVAAGGEEGSLYVDAFNGGRIMTAEGLRSVVMRLRAVLRCACMLRSG